MGSVPGRGHRRQWAGIAAGLAGLAGVSGVVASSRAAEPNRAATAAPAPASAPQYRRSCTTYQGEPYCYLYGRQQYCIEYRGQTTCHPYAGGGQPPPAPSARPAPTTTAAPAATAPPTATAPYAPASVQPTGSATVPPAAGGEAGQAPATSLAGMVPGETLGSGARTLERHTFHIPRYLDNAFVTTSFGLGAGVEFYEQDSVQTEAEVAPGRIETFTYDRDLVYARLGADLEIAPWEIFSFGGRFEYLGQMGVNEQSLFLFGADTGYAIRPALKFRLWRGYASGSQLGLQVHGAFSGGLRVVPQGMLRELSEELTDIAQDDARTVCLVAADFDCAFEEVDLTTAMRVNHQRWGAGGSLSFAQAFGSAFGMQLTAGLEGAASNFSWRYLGDIDGSAVVFYTGIAPSLNFAPDFPLGITAEYRLDVDYTSFSADETGPIKEDISNTVVGHKLAAGLYYTGRRDLMLGAILGLSFLDESVAVGPSNVEQPGAFVIAIQIDMRYFF